MSKGMDALTARISRLLRWIFFLPVSLGAGFLVGGLIHLLAGGEAGASSGAVAYASAFLSGLAYVLAALRVAHTVAPSHKRIVVTVLGILILGDLGFVHLILQTDLIQQDAMARSGEGGLGVLLGLLRADDYSRLRYGGLVKIGGAVIGCYIALTGVRRNKKP